MHSSLKAIKKGRIIGPGLKLTVFILLFIVLVFQLQNRSIDLQGMKLVNPIILCLLAIFSFIQWYFEYLKWNMVCNYGETFLTASEKFKAFYQGIISGFLIPGGQFNFVGRMISFTKEENRRIVPLTWYANASQFFPSIVFGAIAFFIYQNQIIEGYESETLFFISKLAFIVCLTSWILFLFAPFEKLNLLQGKLMSAENIEFNFRVKVSGLSLLRYIIFVGQFSTLLYAFGERVSLETIGGIMIVYFFLTISPSLMFGKLVIREVIAIWILVPFGIPVSIILATTFLIWLFNNVVPVIWSGFKAFRTNV
ncbi:MAG: flippase-like domain-containing protein [Bacteroidetes bacterium]|nr:flippase-like domain-containing protein [Bacteroidota bacterium]